MLRSWLAVALLLGPFHAFPTFPQNHRRGRSLSSPAKAQKNLQPNPLSNRQLRKKAKSLSYHRKKAIVDRGNSVHWERALLQLDRYRCDGGADVYAFGATIAACARAGRHAEALRLLQVDMPSDGVAPTVATCNAALLACERAGRFPEALKLLHSMQNRSTMLLNNEQQQQEEEEEVGIAGGSNHHQVSRQEDDAPRGGGGALPLLVYPAPDLYSYNAVLGACAAKGSWASASAAIDLLVAMDRASSPKPLLGQLWGKKLKARAVTRRPKKSGANKAAAALPVALGGRAAATSTSVAPDARSFSLAIRACGAAGEWKCALGVWEALRIPTAGSDNNEQPEAPAADSDSAVAPAPVQTTGLYASEFSLSAVLEALSASGQARVALAVLESAQATHGVAPNRVCVNVALNACAKEGRWEDALSLLQGLRTRRWSPPPPPPPYQQDQPQDQQQRQKQEQKEEGGPDVVSYGAALSACEKAGRWDKALELLRTMGAETETAVAPNAHCYGAAISACGKGGEWRLSLELLAEALAMPTGQQRNKLAAMPTPHCANAAISACGRSGRWREAVGLVAAMAIANPPAAAAATTVASGSESESDSDGGPQDASVSSKSGLAAQACLSTMSMFAPVSPGSTSGGGVGRSPLPAPDVVSFCAAFQAVESSAVARAVGGSDADWDASSSIRQGSSSNSGSFRGEGGEPLKRLDQEEWPWGEEEEWRGRASASQALMDVARQRGFFAHVWAGLPSRSSSRRRQEEEEEEEEEEGEEEEEEEERGKTHQSAGKVSRGGVVDLRGLPPAVAKSCLRCLLRDLRQGTVAPQDIRVLTVGSPWKSSPHDARHDGDDGKRVASSSPPPPSPPPLSPSLEGGVAGGPQESGGDGSSASGEKRLWALTGLADAALGRLEGDAVFRTGLTLGRSFFYASSSSSSSSSNLGSNFDSNLGSRSGSSSGGYGSPPDAGRVKSSPPPPSSSSSSSSSSTPPVLLPSEVKAFLDTCSSVVEFGRSARRKLRLLEVGEGGSESEEKGSDGQEGKEKGKAGGGTAAQKEGGEVRGGGSGGLSDDISNIKPLLPHPEWSWTFEEGAEGGGEGERNTSGWTLDGGIEKDLGVLAESPHAARLKRGEDEGVLVLEEQAILRWLNNP